GEGAVHLCQTETVGSSWPAERQPLAQFAILPLPFHETDPPRFEMAAHWNLDDLIGYLRTWSSRQRFIATKGGDPLEQITDQLRSVWGTPEKTRKASWQLNLSIGLSAKCHSCRKNA